MDLSFSAKSRFGKGAVALMLAASMGVVGVSAANADKAYADEPTPYWSTPLGGNPNSNLLKTYGVRAGSAGGDFLGITNTNFDFSKDSSASSATQFMGYASADYLNSSKAAGLAIWATSVNESANPYYRNLYANAIRGTSYAQATTWMSNPSTSSWGDSNGSASNVGNVSTGAATIAGLEYSPDIIFGANKMVNWNLAANGSNSGTNIANSGYSATYVNNDATNLWTQVYTMGQLATAADSLTDNTSKVTRYNNSDAQQSAVDYEKATKGQMLYVASQIDSGAQAKKTVAYLYAIDANGTGYFFTPTASGLVSGNDTGANATTVAAANSNYAANNSTINMGYMGTLPFISDTFNSGTAVSGGIVMKVEDIYKSNPACSVATTAGATDSVLADVDVIIYNSTTQTTLNGGTKNGMNESGVNNDYQGDALSKSEVSTWAAAHGFTGTQVVAGDDFGTSSVQNMNTTDAGTAPVLYCQRNYTADKNARAAWAFAQVYPELYGNNANATYAYWVDNVYHVKTANVSAVVQYMTKQSNTVSYDSSVETSVSDKANAGYTWWNATGKNKAAWSQFAYYNGSSRASYYSGDSSAAEGTNVIGIFAPSSLWTGSN